MEDKISAMDRLNWESLANIYPVIEKIRKDFPWIKGIVSEILAGKNLYLGDNHRSIIAIQIYIAQEIKELNDNLKKLDLT